MILVRLFISCAGDADDLRDIAADVMHRLTQMFVSQTPWPLFIYQWDYRKDPGGPIPADQLAARSLEELRLAEGVVAIFSARVGKIATEEIRVAFELRLGATGFEIWPYLDPAKRGLAHTTLMRSIARRYSPLRLVYEPYSDPFDFQAKLFTTLVPYLLKRAGVFVPARITSLP
jgi:hypothetical protein